MTHPGGRPLKFKSVEELQAKIDAYFAECDPHIVTKTVLKFDKKLDEYFEKEVRVMTTQIPYTITGLALALDTSRETLLDYEAKDEYSDTVKRAKLKIHNYTELKLFESNATGPIFNLKNNYGWKDKTEVDARVESVTPILGGNTKDDQDTD